MVASAADCPSGQTQSIVGLVPISSHYVKRTLERIDDGIANAKDMPDYSDFDAFFINQWTWYIARAVNSLVDTDLRVAEYTRGLRDDTTCLDIDLQILEAKMDEIRCKMMEATEDNSPGGIVLLKALLRFTNARYAHLVHGARDPTYRDVHWGQWRIFDDPAGVWCCVRDGSDEENTCQQRPSREACYDGGGANDFESLEACVSWGCEPPGGSYEPDPDNFMCPFHSNYLPPTAYGFGCDEEVLVGDVYATTLEFVLEEESALIELNEKRNEFIDEFEDVKDLTIQLDTIMGRTPPDLSRFGIVRDREHKEIFGCLETIPNFFSSSSSSAGSSDSSSSQAIQTNVIYQTGATQRALRGPFSLEKDEAILMQELLELRAGWGAKREQADYLKRPSEFVSSASGAAALEREKEMDFAEKRIRAFSRKYMSNWNKHQSTLESTVVGRALDSQLQIVGLLKGVRQDVLSFSNLAYKRDEGIRKFIRGFGWHLMRSCIERPCSARLERILRIVLQDQCFPYVDGSFIGNTQVYDNCKDAAEL